MRVAHLEDTGETMNPNAAIAKAIERIRRLPAHLERLVANCAPAQLTTHFLENEWTVAQNVHHLADSHMNSYSRCKLILTEQEPTLKPYDQDRWASLPDARDADVSTSLALLRALHSRWVTFWRSLAPEDWARGGLHPESGHLRLDAILFHYADHGEAHIDQITRTLVAQYADQPASSAEMLANMTREWNALLTFVRCNESALLEPLESTGSGKDHLAHVTAWETFLLRHHLDQEDAAVALELSPQQYAALSTDQINAVLHMRSQDKTLSEVLADAEKTHAIVVERLRNLPFAVLQQPRDADDESGAPLLHWVIGNTYNHYLEHGLYLRTHLPVP